MIAEYNEPLQALEAIAAATQDARQSGDRLVEMTAFEVGFLCGCIRQHTPRKILEVGVAAGGTTAVMLKTLDMLGLEAEVISVDIAETYYANPQKASGYVVEETVPQLTGNWRMLRGKSLAEVIDGIGGGIDLCILDTMHVLPGECLDYLAVLPYMAENGMFVLHDVHCHQQYVNVAYATKVLLDSVAADKYVPLDKNSVAGLANIAAFTINEDTRKYVFNTFSALSMPWEYMPDDAMIRAYNQHYLKHYPEPYANYFTRAVAANKNYLETREARILKEFQDMYARFRGRMKF